MNPVLTGFDVPLRLRTTSEAAGMKSQAERQSEARKLIRTRLEIGGNYSEKDFEKAIENGEHQFALQGSTTLEFDAPEFPIVLSLPIDARNPETTILWDEKGEREFTVDRPGEFEGSPVADIVTVRYSRYAYVKLRSMLVNNDVGCLLLDYTVGAYYRSNK